MMEFAISGKEKDADHMYQLLKESMTSRLTAPCLGVRKVTGETTEKNPDGRSGY